MRLLRRPASGDGHASHSYCRDAGAIDLGTNSNHRHRRTKKSCCHAPLAPPTPCPLLNTHSKVWHLRSFSDRAIFSCYRCVPSSHMAADNRAPTSQERTDGKLDVGKGPRDILPRLPQPVSPRTTRRRWGRAVPQEGGEEVMLSLQGNALGPSAGAIAWNAREGCPLPIPGPLAFRPGRGPQAGRRQGEGRGWERALLLALSPPTPAGLMCGAGQSSAPADLPSQAPR